MWLVHRFKRSCDVRTKMDTTWWQPEMTSVERKTLSSSMWSNAMEFSAIWDMISFINSVQFLHFAMMALLIFEPPWFNLAEKDHRGSDLQIREGSSNDPRSECRLKPPRSWNQWEEGSPAEISSACPLDARSSKVANASKGFFEDRRIEGRRKWETDRDEKGLGLWSWCCIGWSFSGMVHSLWSCPFRSHV